MALCRFAIAEHGSRWGWVRDGLVFPLDDDRVARCFAGTEEGGLLALQTDLDPSASISVASTPQPAFLAPVGHGQEIWAAGVTYESSKFARMAESAEGSDFYARVYVAERPELFLKATARRVVGPNAPVRIRADSSWNVPEPELAIVAAANGAILGYTIGNDMSSRDIEGANPLYLPQAKVYRGSCALGPVIVPADRIDPRNLAIQLTIRRSGNDLFHGETSTSRMRRTPEDLVDWLFRENDFPQGVVLLTGTGIIPPEEFSLDHGDEVTIEIEGIGALRNTVE